ncbi:MAG: zinc ribbon domain-containing protein [Pseudomonadota bacterium]
MPIYEYECDACGSRFEAIQKISDDPLTECRKCGATGSVRKLVSAAAFRLKGSGWYETDFKKGDKKKNLAGDEKPGSGGKAEGKADGKKADGGKKESKAKDSGTAKNAASGS